jgi:hypothetical protein
MPGDLPFLGQQLGETRREVLDGAVATGQHLAREKRHSKALAIGRNAL